MHFTIQLVIENEGGHEAVEEIIQLDKSCNEDSMVGMSLTESKLMLKKLQKQMIIHQVTERLAQHKQCSCCHNTLKLKDYHCYVSCQVFK